MIMVTNFTSSGRLQSFEGKPMGGQDGVSSDVTSSGQTPPGVPQQPATCGHHVLSLWCDRDHGHDHAHPMS